MKENKMNTQDIFYDLLNAIYNNDRVATNEKLLQLLELNKSNESLPTVEKIYRFGGSYQVWRKSVKQGGIVTFTENNQ